MPCAKLSKCFNRSAPRSYTRPAATFRPDVLTPDITHSAYAAGDRFQGRTERALVSDTGAFQIAMVGEDKWQHGMAIFCKPFTKAMVRYDYRYRNGATRQR
jgi:hypothetical protein